jgi:hypothetical protein
MTPFGSVSGGAHTVVTMSRDSTGELRGTAARLMIAEDARWAMDVVLSGQQASEISGYLPLLLGHHWVRIAYEGALAVRSKDTHVGVPALAALLQDRFALITARARHAAKLLDDTKKTYIDVLTDFDRILTDHHEQLTGNTFRWARWLETDLGLYYCKDRLAGATVPAAYRLGLTITDDGTIAGEDLRAVTEEWGGTLAVLGAAALDAREPTGTIDFASDCAISYRDRVASRYFPRRFETEFHDSLKALLLLIEGDLNTARTLLPHTSQGHEQPVFRARTISLCHSLTALQRIASHYSSLDTAGLRGLRGLLTDAPTQRLLSREGNLVRNRCVHYQMDDPAVRIDLSLPMFGIVEGVYPGNTWARFDADVAAVTGRVADHLSNWRPA